jgi:hypothetical protein
MYFGELINVYNTQLMSNTGVSDLMSRVVQDPTGETIDYAATNEKFAELDVKEHQEQRRTIIGWLNQVFSVDLKEALPVEFWWEMNTRLKKLMIISIILERKNLQSFGVAKCDWGDIPQCLLHICDRHREAAAHFEELRTRQLQRYEVNRDLFQFYTDF